MSILNGWDINTRRATWQLFATIFGVENLLPFVHNYALKPADFSSLSTTGKVPSRKVKGGVCGIVGWQNKRTTTDEIREWAKDEDYGILNVARKVFAIDVDIDDQELADSTSDIIEKFIERKCGFVPPCRYRENSGKRLYIFSIKDSEDVFSKFKLDTKGGMIEFLFQSQQFAVAGKHPSGVMYQWRNLSVDNVPSLLEKDFVSLVETLCNSCSNGEYSPVVKYVLHNKELKRGVIAETRKQNYSKVSISELLDKYKDDEEACYVINHECFIEVLPNGFFAVKCPHEMLHTTEGNTSSTVYIPASEDRPSAYRCLHNTHGSITKKEFLKSIGYNATSFSDIGEDDSERKVNSRIQLQSINNDPRLAMTEKECRVQLRNIMENDLLTGVTKDGTEIILPNSVNLEVFATNLHLIMPNHALRYDNFSKLMEIHDNFGWRPFEDNDYVAIKNAIARKFRFKTTINTSDIKEAVRIAAHKYVVDSAAAYIEGLPEWDGVDRISQLSDMLHTRNKEYHRTAWKYTFASLVSRMMAYKDSVKVDMMPVLVGSEGIGKSTFVRELAFMPEASAEMSFKSKADDLIRITQGSTVVELAELDGMSAQESSFIKAFITRQEDQWIQKYKEHKTRSSRRFIIIGTTNEYRFLTPSMGIRRWLPMKIDEGCKFNHGWISRNKEQLYAQAVVEASKFIETMYVLEKLAKDVVKDYVWHDPMQRKLDDWIIKQSKRAKSGTYATTFDVILDKCYNKSLLGMRINEVRYYQKLVQRSFTRYIPSTDKWEYDLPTALTEVEDVSILV